MGEDPLPGRDLIGQNPFLGDPAGDDVGVAHAHDVGGRAGRFAEMAEPGMDAAERIAKGQRDGLAGAVGTQVAHAGHVRHPPKAVAAPSARD